MTNGNVSIDGVITLWELSGRSDYTRLEQGMTNLGLDKFVPHMATTLEALKIVLQGMFHGTRSLIRPLEGYKGFGVVYETANAEKLSHQNDLSVIVTGKGQLAFYGASYSQEWEIKNKVQDEESNVPQAKLAYMLKRLIAEKLNGIPIRESGGVYYLPDSAVPMWNDIAVVVESAGSNTVHTIRTAIDDRAVTMVTIYLQKEIEGFIAKANADISTLGSRALSNRFNECADMLEKAKAYEQRFGVLLTGASEALAGLQVQLMMTGTWAE